jgi:hypothetical protein
MGIIYNGEKVNDHTDNTLTLFHQNIRGLSNKSEEVIFLMDEELNPNVMCFTEHHIPELSPGFINLENYILGASFSRRYQKGGVCVFLCRKICLLTVLIFLNFVKKKILNYVLYKWNHRTKIFS